MAIYTIEGGCPLSGVITASGNKNAALPCLAATLLTDEEVILRNIANIEDTRRMMNILVSLGSTVEPLDENNTYRIKTANITTHRIPSEEASAIRASILFAGPLLARIHRVTLPPPGGDVIGRRRLDTHFLMMQALGASVKIDSQFTISVKRLIGASIFLDESSVTATENAIMMAVLAEGNTVIENAASEPHIQDLCNMLNLMGAKITGIGSNIVAITGVKKLHGAEFRIGPDYMEIGSLIGLAAATKSEITIQDIAPNQLKMMEIVYGRLGIHWETSGSHLYVPKRQKLRIVPDLGGAIPKVDDAPWPGFPADLISIVLVVATQTQGALLVHEKMFESRMFFVDKLIGMGAQIVLCDPHRAVVSGPTNLTGSDLISPDVRAGMAMLIAALCANGKSVMRNIYQIERGYENLARRLSALGADIRRVADYE